MSFLYSWFLWLLLPIGIYLYRREKKQSLSQNMRWVVLILLIISISRPVIKGKIKDEKVSAHSIIIALDISASMRADDIKPSRQIASKTTIKTFLKKNKKDQIALIGFTINPLLLSPPTTDHNLISIALDTLKSEYILTKGTNLKRLFKKIAKFPNSKKIVILFSDGGDEVIDDELISIIEEENIKILTVAMATKEGSSIKSRDGELLKDKKGHIVVSKLNSELSKISKVIKFKNAEETSSFIEEWIEGLDIDKKGIERKNYNYIELFPIPTILALIALFLSSTRFILKFILLLSLFGIRLQAFSIFDNYYLNRAYSSYKNRDYNSSLELLEKVENKSLESQIVLANSYYRLKLYKRAKSLLKSIKTTNPKIKQQLLYNLGNCEAELAYYEKAKDYYIKALSFGEDNDTLHNLKAVIFLKEKHKSKLGFTNPNSPQASNSKSKDNTDAKDKPKSKDKKVGNSSGGSSKISKNSTIKELKTNSKTSSKRQISSKAYDLINKGYIKEGKPW